jgi:hypothetical protein
VTLFEIGLFGWMALMAFVFFSSATPRHAERACLLVAHAGRDDSRVPHSLARERLAAQSWHQDGDVMRSVVSSTRGS